MTPTWMEANESYIDSSRSTTAEELILNAGLVNFDDLLKVPMIPAKILHYSNPLIIKIVVAQDISIEVVHDSDISCGVSD